MSHHRDLKLHGRTGPAVGPANTSGDVLPWEDCDSTNLWRKQWRAESIAKARRERDTVAASYAALKGKTTEYARSMQMVLELREQVLALWLASPVDLPEEACPTTA